MTSNIGLSGGPRPVLHGPHDQYPHGPFATEMAPSLIVQSRGAFSSDFRLVLLAKMPDVDGARGVVLVDAQYAPIKVQLADFDRAHLVVAQTVRFDLAGCPPVAGAALINAAGDLEASGRLMGRSYQKEPPTTYVFTPNGILVRKPIADR